MKVIRNKTDWNTFITQESEWDDEEFIQTPEKFPCLVKLQNRIGNVRFVEFIYYDEAKLLVDTANRLCCV